MTLKKLYKIDIKLFQLAVAYSVLDGRSFNFDTAILNAFTWSATKEREIYWNSVYVGETTTHTREYKPPYYVDSIGNIFIGEVSSSTYIQITNPLQIQNYLEKRFPEIKEFTSKANVEDIPKLKTNYDNMTLYELHNTNLVLFQLVVMELILQKKPLVLGKDIRSSFAFDESIQGRMFWYDVVERSIIGVPIHVIPYLKTKKKLIKPVNSSVIGMTTRYLEKEYNCPSGALIRKHGSSSTKWSLKKRETIDPHMPEVPERPIDANTAGPNVIDKSKHDWGDPFERVTVNESTGIGKSQSISTPLYNYARDAVAYAAKAKKLLHASVDIAITNSQSKPIEIEPLVIKKKTTKYLKI